MESHRPAAAIGPVRRAGYAALVLAGATGTVCLLSTYGFSWTTTGLADGLTTLLPVPVAFVCGLAWRREVGLIAAAWMAATIELTQGYVNPFVLVLIFGPWLVGAVVRDRRQLTQRLTEVGWALEAESERLADEAVRLERARIARELHDIVAHCVSVMVVQAYAGERLATADQGSAVEAFEHIADAAGQAKQEIAHLVNLLAHEATARPDVELTASLHELVAGASATGLDIRLHLNGHPEQVPPATAAVAYRVVQESLTNAIKHAPGAPILISVDCGQEMVIDVVNGTSHSARSQLAASGGGRGLAGILAAGPNDPGAWRVSVQFPGR
jgi:signal transduction histidine kinase